MATRLSNLLGMLRGYSRVAVAKAKAFLARNLINDVAEN